MILERQLDSTERFYAATRGEGNLTVEYRGTVDEEALLSAYQHLCLRHPALTATLRIDSNSGNWLMTTAVETEPQIINIKGDFATLFRQIGENTRIVQGAEYVEDRNPQRPFSRLIHTQDEGCGYVTLGIDHILSDVIAEISYMRQLWDIYTAIVLGRHKIEPAGGQLPYPPSQLFQERYGSKIKIAAPAQTTAMDIWDKTSTGAGEYKTDISMFRLTSDNTFRIRRAARHRGISVYKLLAGSMASALQRYDPVNFREMIKIFTFIGLRQHVDPPVSATDTTAFIAPFLVAIPVDDDPVQMGNEFEGRIRQAIECKALRIVDSAESILPMHTADLCLNNAGIIQRFETPEELEIVDWFPLYFKHKRINYWVAGRQRLGAAFWTYNERLTLVFSTRSDTTKELIDCIAHQLNALDNKIALT